MRPGNVPTARLGPIIEALVKDRWSHGGGYGVLAEKVGCDESAIEGIVEQTWEGCEFDLADKVLCGLGRVDLWRGELSDVYLSIHFVQTCALPACFKTFPETNKNGNQQKYCSANCRMLHSDVRRGTRTGERLRKKNRCLKGHLLTPDNVKLIRRGDGTTSRRCRTCKKKLEREAYRLKHNVPVERQKVAA